MVSELKVRTLLLRCYHGGMNAKLTSDKIREKFGVKGYAERTCQRWYKKFRDGDFNLSEKPCYQRKKSKRKPPEKSKPVKETFKIQLPPKEVKMEAVSPCQQENRPQNTRTRTGSIVVRKLAQKHRDITASPVKPGTIRVVEHSRLRASRPPSNESTASAVRQGTIRVKAASGLMAKRVGLPLNRELAMSVPKAESYNQRRSACAVLQARRPVAPNGLTSRSQSRLRGGLNTELMLPPSIAKRMTTAQLSTENHTIGEPVKGAGQKSSETAKKSITVQFQNVSPEVAKNTVRKSTESGAQPAVNGIKKLSTQSTSPLASPKGVIYLNPQEIFGEKLSAKSQPRKMPAHAVPAARPPPSAVKKKVTKPSPAPVAPPAPPPTVTVDDSDSDDDLLFPENVSLPPPKVKAVVNTFTTYWDMESDQPIQLNPTSEAAPAPSVIEIE